MQPPLDDQQVDHPAHPARQPDRLVQGSCIDISSSENLWNHHSKDDDHPNPESHDGEGQRNAAQHPPPVIGKTALADRSKTSQRCPKPQQCKQGVGHPLIGAIQVLIKGLRGALMLAVALQFGLTQRCCAWAPPFSPRPLHPRLVPDRLSRLVNTTVGAEDQKPVEAPREPPVVRNGNHRAFEGIEA